MSGTVRYAFLLLGLHVRLLSRWGVRKYTRTSREAAPVRLLLAIVVLVWLGASVGLPLTAFLAHASRGPVARADLEGWLAWATTISSVVIFAYSILSWIGRLTYANDLRLLIMTPISPALLLAEKVAAASLSYTGLLLLTLPGTFVVGENLHLGAAFDVFAVVVVLLLPVLPTCLSMLLVLAVLRWIPPARARAVASFSGVVIGGATFVSTQLLLSRSVRSHLSAVPPHVPSWVPFAWPARALAAVGLHHPVVAGGYLAAALAISAVVAFLSVRVAGWQLALGSGTYAEVPRRTRARSHRSSWRIGVMRRGLFVPQNGWGALWTKDWLTLRRDPVQLAQLAYPLILVAFYVYRNLAAGSGRPFRIVGTSATLYSLSAMTAVLVLGSFVPMLVNREGKSLYLLNLAPLSTRSLFREKWVVGVMPPLFLAEAVLVVVARLLGTGVATGLASAVCIAVLVVVLVGLTLTVHLTWPRLNASEVRRQGSTVAGIVSFVLDVVVSVIVGILFNLVLVKWQDQSSLALVIGSGTALLLLALLWAVNVVGPRVFARLLVSEAAR